MSRRLAAGVAIAAAVAGWFALGRALPVQPAGASRADAPLRVASSLPAWRAPGARLSVVGWAGAGATVRLVADGRAIGRARAGTLGRFTFAAKAPRRSGLYRLEVVSDGRRRSLGRLRVRPVVVAAAGDVNLGDRTAHAISAHGAGYPWTGIAPVLRTADLAIANLECAVSRGGVPAAGKEYTFRGSPAAMPAMARAGIDVLSLANNHSVDYGTGALLDTIRHARRAGLATVGAGADLAAAVPCAATSAGSASRSSATPTSGRSASTRATAGRVPCRRSRS